MATHQVITARILIEPGTESVERTRGYVVSAIKSSLRNIRDGSVVIALYNEEGDMLAADVTGVPSETLQEEFDAIFARREIAS